MAGPVQNAPGPGGADHNVSEVVRGAIHDFVRSHERRRRELPRTLAVGLLAGAAGVAFTQTLAAAEALRTTLLASARDHPGWGPLVPILVGAVGGAIAVGLVRSFAPEASGSGIPHLKAVIRHGRPLRWARVLAVKFIGGVAGIGGGLTLGREGPTIQMGAAMGELVSRRTGSSPGERQTLITAGAGAGLAAAFNAPLSGLVFVLEEVQRDLPATVFTATLAAAVMADVVARLASGQLPEFHLEMLAAPSLLTIPVALVVGVVTAILGVAFNRGLVWTLDAFDRLRRVPAWASGAIGGAAVGAVGWFVPSALGGGYDLVGQTLAGGIPLAAIAGLFVLRFAMTMVSYGCGAPGGIFAPLLVLGALAGLAVGMLAQSLWPATFAHPPTFAVVGMAAYFSAIVRAPLTGIVLMVEMTGNYTLVLPLLVACLTAYGVADMLRDRPIYEALLERDLLRAHEAPSEPRTQLLELTVAPGAPFDGRLVRELGLPPGCVLLTIHRGSDEVVPALDTRLASDDRITAVVSPDAADAVALLRQGTGDGA
jgi:CIC family chloride channel protein